MSECLYCKMMTELRSKGQVYANSMFKVLSKDDLRFISVVHDCSKTVQLVIEMEKYCRKLFGAQSSLEIVNEKEHVIGIVKDSMFWTKERPRFSVITPVRSGEAGLLRLMLSMMRLQTFSNYEHIIIEDGNLDNSVKDVVDAEREFWQDKDRLIHLRVEGSKWGNRQRREGIKVAKGEYIVFIDDDDLPTSTWLESANEVGSLGVLLLGAIWKSGVRKYLPDKIPIRMGYISSQNICVRKEVAQQVGWPDSEEYEADFRFIESCIEMAGSYKWVGEIGVIINGLRS